MTEENIKSVEVNFDGNGNWEEHVTTLPLFTAMVKAGISSLTITPNEVDSLVNYTGKITNLGEEGLKFEIYEKQYPQEEAVAEEAVSETAD